MSVRCNRKKDPKGRTMCFFLLYSDAAGTVPAMFGSAMIRQVIIAVPKKVVGSDILATATSNLTKKIEALFEKYGDAYPSGTTPRTPSTPITLDPLW